MEWSQITERHFRCDGVLEVNRCPRLDRTARSLSPSRPPAKTPRCSLAPQSGADGCAQDSDHRQQSGELRTVGEQGRSPRETHMFGCRGIYHRRRGALRFAWHGAWPAISMRIESNRIVANLSMTQRSILLRCRLKDSIDLADRGLGALSR
jgi:hypothetical protein